MVEKTKYYCKLCDFYGTSRQSIYQHRQTAKHIWNDNCVNIPTIPKRTKIVPKPIPNIYNTIICEYCNKQFTQKSSLNRHLNKGRCKLINVNTDGTNILDIPQICDEINDEETIPNMVNDTNGVDIIVLIDKVDEISERLNETQEENKGIKEVLEETLDQLDKTKGKLAYYQEINNNIINHNSIINNTINNNQSTTNNIETVNMNNINNLNMYFGNLIPMETFLYNMEHVNKISMADVENLLYSSKNMGIEDLANCFEKIISKNCIEQTRNMTDNNGTRMLPALPVLCTDGNMRTHKERLVKSWDTIYNDIHFVKMWDIVNNRVYELTNEYIHVPQKHKKKLYSRIKKKVCIKDLFEMQDKLNKTL